MKAYQREVRERQELEGTIQGLFPLIPSKLDLKSTLVREIGFNTAKTIILQYEWIGTMPLPKSCRYMFGIYFDGILGGAIIYVEPSTRQFVKAYPRQVVQLNRGACAYWTPKNSASRLIATSLKVLRQRGVKLIIAYCTPEAGEIGTIYQALGWWYVGQTSSSNTYYLDGHWVSERTLADKIAWAKNKGERWQAKFRDLPCRPLQPKYKYIKLLMNGEEGNEIARHYDFKALPYLKRGNNE